MENTRKNFLKSKGYDFESMAETYLLVDSEIDESKHEKSMKSCRKPLQRNMTVLNHLVACQESWKYLREQFQTSKTELDLVRNEIDFGEFRSLADKPLFLMYVLHYLQYNLNLVD
jgi:hypothetical protein